jgi:hypothetical protein
MKYLVMSLFLSSCAAVADSNPPNGEEVFRIFFSSMNRNLNKEPLCNANMKLYEQLSVSLSVAHESQNIIKIKSSCESSKFEVKPKNIIDIWDCTVQINEDTKEGEFISSSTYVFGVSQTERTIINGSLRCR